MGITPNVLRFLLLSVEEGTDFARTATLGRQKLELSWKEAASVFREFGRREDPETLRRAFASGYAEDLLKFLGAGTVESFDCSDYEGATHVHDFNSPIPDGWAARFTAVIDGGTLEHVFNFPAAVGNAMRLLAAGGRYLGVSPANNYLGHGFYQFSPELWYRVFSPENGFRILRMFCHEGRETREWFSVPDPARAGRRLSALTAAPLLLLTLAEKVEERPLFASPPLQSDYLPVWSAPAGSEAASGPGRLDGLKKRFVFRLRRIVPFLSPRRRFPPEFQPFSPCERRTRRDPDRLGSGQDAPPTR